MAYDAVGNRRFLADSTGRYTTLYDSLNRARAATTPANLTMTIAFDAAGRRRTLVEPSGGTFTYGYDLANRNTLVINPQSERTSWTYDAGGRATIQRLSNLMRVSLAYDAADRLIRLANLTSTGTTITSFVDTWDGAGNRLHRVEQDATRVTWSYDATYQLTRERRNGANSYDTTYSYDAAGNRRTKLDNAVTTTYSYDAANQLTKYVDNTGTTTFAFDANGNQRLQIASAGGGTTTNTWDFENRLIKVAPPGGVLNTFSYNGDGQRVQRADSTGTLKEVWDGQKILLETNASNVTQVIYTLSPGLYGDLISQRRLGVSRYSLFDPLGSASRLTDGTQSVTDSYLFKGFGEALLPTGATTNPFTFVGRLGYYVDPDVTNLYLRARSYVPRLSRFLSTDLPLVRSREYRYAYSANSPTRYSDPSGHVKIEIVRGPTNLVCGGFRFLTRLWSTIMPPQKDEYLDMQLVVVQKVTLIESIFDCSATPASCPDCGKKVARPNQPPCVFYESFLTGSILRQALEEGGVRLATDVIESTRVSLPWGCPNTFGRRAGVHEIHVILADGDVLAEWRQKFTHRTIPCHGSVLGVGPSALGWPIPTLWANSIVVDRAQWAYTMWWDCCSKHTATQILRWGNDPSGTLGGTYSEG
jgi:RHS repeat-associated protein